MTMEGFEYNNFSSKYVVSTRSNGKGNIVMQSMRVLHLLFRSGYHNVECKKKRPKKETSNENQNNTNSEDDIIYGDALVDGLIECILELLLI